MGLLKIPFLLISLAAFSSTPAAALKKRGFQEMDGTLFSWLLHKDSQPQKVESLSQGYMSNVELKEAIIEIGQRCHHISNIYSIGKSVKGFPLLVIELSDKPGQEEAEPAFKKDVVAATMNAAVGACNNEVFRKECCRMLEIFPPYVTLGENDYKHLEFLERDSHFIERQSLILIPIASSSTWTF